jgi:hypothetical protein
MRRQARPFIVEVKKKRSGQMRDRSIWSGIDLSSVHTEDRGMQKASEPTQFRLVETGLAAIDCEDGQNNTQGEQHMNDRKETVSVPTPTEAPVTGEQPKAKAKVSRAKAGNGPKRAARKLVASPAPAAVQSSATVRTRKIYSANERAQKLEQIEKSTGRGESVKNAAKQAGVSEQTYYQWKKAAAPAKVGGELKDLLALENENKRLKNLLAERLRKENAELKKKLGLA